MKSALRAAVGRIPERYRRGVFYLLARDLGVSMVEIEGDNGVITGLVGDELFAQYILRRSWSSNICDLARTAFANGPSGGTFLDIGANIGLTLIPIARDLEVSCLAFEPEPRNWALLQRNVARNCARPDIRLFNLALFDTEGEIEFELSPTNFGDHRVRNRSSGSFSVFREEQRSVISVPTRRLDDLIDAAALKHPVVAKVDTQGAEGHIYRGGPQVFAATDVLFMEFWPYGIERMGGDSGGLIDSIARDYSHGCFLEERRVPSTAAFRTIEDVAADMRQTLAHKDITSADINTHDLVFVKDPSLLAT